MKDKVLKYEFRAMTIKKTIISMVLWLIIAVSITYPIEQLFNYDNLKKPSVFDNILVYGTIIIASFIAILVISHFMISSIYSIQLFNNKITISKKNKIKYHFLLEDIEYIQLGISQKPVTSGIIIKTLKNKLILYNGLFFTYYKEKKILENIIIKNINPFFENLEIFDLEIKKDKNSIAYIYTKK